MPFPFLTREVFDTLIFVVILFGGALAVVRLYRDFTRPLRPDPSAEETHPTRPDWSDEDTQHPVHPHES